MSENGLRCSTYIVMQSDGNIFFEEVVLDIFIMAYRDDIGTAFKTIYTQSKYFRILKIEENSNLKKYSTLQQGTHEIRFYCYSHVNMYFRMMLKKFKLL